MAETYCGSSPTQTKLRLSPLFLRALNMRYAILFALSMLHYERWQEMQRSVLPEYRPESDWRGMRVGEYDQTKHFPSSLWLRVEG